MKLENALKLARSLMDEFGLKKWKIKINKSRVDCGVCDFDEKTIYFSEYFLKLNRIKQIKDIILHEIAHAILPIEAGHSQIWKDKCIEIGCTPERFASVSCKMPEMKWKGKCPNCLELNERHYKPDTQKWFKCLFCEYKGVLKWHKI